MATLEQFLRTGDLDPIRFGMTKDEVEEALGWPQSWVPHSWSDDPRMPHAAYGGLHLTFSRTGPDPKHRLAHIGLYFDPLRGPIPERVQPTDWLPTSETTEAEFSKFLDGMGLAPERRLRGESNLHLFLSTGARATFANDRLHSVEFSAPRTPTKQISITVSAETLAALREQAKRANRSVSALCAEWITERANSPQVGAT